MQFGVAAETTATRQFIDVSHAEPPRATVEKRPHFTMLRLALEFVGTHPQNTGGFFETIELSHGELLLAVVVSFHRSGASAGVHGVRPVR